MIPQLIAACAGIRLLAGLWTPVVGTLIAVIELWVIITHPGDPWISIVLTTLEQRELAAVQGITAVETCLPRLR
jgi:hypothetical protein